MFAIGAPTNLREKKIHALADMRDKWQEAAQLRTEEKARALQRCEELAEQVEAPAIYRHRRRHAPGYRRAANRDDHLESSPMLPRHTSNACLCVRPYTSIHMDIHMLVHADRGEGPRT